jgi:regulator of sigma E protease
MMNVVLAWVLMSFGFAWGVPAVVEPDMVLQHGARVSEPRITILDVEPNSPAAVAGLHGGDSIIQIDGMGVTSISEVQSYVAERKGQEFKMRVMRGQESYEFSVQSRTQLQPGQGPTGVALGMVGSLRYPWYYAPVMGLKSVYSQLGNIFGGLYSLVSGQVMFGQLGGPAKIAQLTGQASQLGFAYVLQFTAFLSLNLAVFNVLPIPALDGGRVLFLIIEKVRGRKNNQAVEAWVNSIGFIALLGLILAVSVNDIRSFGGVGQIVSKLFGG